MPIRPDLRPLYRTPEWRAARRRVLERAGGQFDTSGRYLGGAHCEECGKPDRTHVYVYAMSDERRGGLRVQYWTAEGRSRWRDCFGKLMPRALWPAAGLPRRIWAEIGVCHRNGRAGDDRPENLAAWCQWCHLHHDALQHRETRCARKDAARPLLEALA